MNAQALCEALRASRGFAHKHDIGAVLDGLAPGWPAAVANGDDCAAIPDPADPAGGGWLLFAIEGFVDDFVERMPWFAGYCGVMVNLSDIAAMGGRPIALVDALWSDGAAASQPVLAGMAEASRRYGVPIVGGHTNQRSARGQLAVAVLGRAQCLLTSFDARPGDTLLAAVDLRGQWQQPFAYWNASTSAPPERLRADLELLPSLAESGLAKAAKDISMAGMVGTALMLLEGSKVGACLEIGAVPRPGDISLDDDAALLRWLTAFPSYGFVLSVRPEHVDAVQSRFRARDIACSVIGRVRRGAEVVLRHRGAEALLWDLAAGPFVGAPGSVLQPARAAA